MLCSCNKMSVSSARRACSVCPALPAGSEWHEAPVPQQIVCLGSPMNHTISYFMFLHVWLVRHVKVRH